MKTTFTKLMMLVALTISAISAQETFAQFDYFRGILKSQGGNEILNSPSDFAPFFIDIDDSFNRDGLLGGSDADGWQVGFVPTMQIDPATGQQVANGPLSGLLAELHGRWVATDDSYVTTSIDGAVRRSSDSGRAVANLPWRVWSALGDNYYIEATATIATGETVSLGYMGDPAFGSALGLDGRLGQLVLNVARGEGANSNVVTTSVSWDNNGLRVVNNTGTFTSAVGEEVTLGLGWKDLLSTGNDLFDAWLVTGGQAQEVGSGALGTAIEVFGTGFELSGTGSSLNGFLTAVPEPNTGSILMLGLMLIGRTIRRGR